ncbi:MAG: Spo0E like sporulation regulatory protein [Clostridiaceae bacterium]|jgi:hypothetical protein|nr:Spo0E like sporulation regulatory protein [Clostridiaceae bacterium]
MLCLYENGDDKMNEALLEKIDSLRDIINKLTEKEQELCKGRALRLSEELDKLINLYYKQDITEI